MKEKGLNVHFLISYSRKYNCPSIEKNAKVINNIFNKEGFKSIVVADSDFELPDNSIFFTMEGRGTDKISNKNNVLKYSLISNCDFVSRYETYADKMDYIIFPNEHFSNYYNKISEKNIFLGSPKYNVELDKEQIFKKYNLDCKEKYALVVFPKLRDVKKSFVDNHIDFLKKMGYKVLVKSRAKDSALDLNNSKYMGDHYFEDSGWYPHDTMELIKISEVILNYGSTMIKEALLTKKPVIYFDVKPVVKNLYEVFWRQKDQKWADDTKFLPFLYDEKVTIEAEASCDMEKFKLYVNKMLKAKNTDYDNVVAKFLFDKNKVCDKIIDHVLKQVERKNDGSQKK
tara:strand:+ start:1147 stop:2172 length:1026 start_codon:yes stop_codon:yes gene_type:complete